MSNPKLVELAQTFLNLSPDGREQFMHKLADTMPEVADWLSIFSQYHQKELERNNE